MLSLLHDAMQEECKDIGIVTRMEQVDRLSSLVSEYTGLSKELAPVALAIVLGLLVLVLFSGFFGSSKRSRSAGDSILLLGHLGSGKSAIAFQLKAKKFVPTVTSMKETDYDVDITSVDSDRIVKARVIDYPGHERLRTGLSSVLPMARGIVFVVDASDLKSSIRPSAELLYDVFTDSAVIDASPRMIVTLNKNDIANVKSVDRVKEELESELTQLKITRSSLETEGEEGEGVIPLGREGQDFKFDIDSPCEVSFGLSSAKTGDIEVVSEFIFECFES